MCLAANKMGLELGTCMCEYLHELFFVNLYGDGKCSGKGFYGEIEHFVSNGLHLCQRQN